MVDTFDITLTTNTIGRDQDYNREIADNGEKKTVSIQ